MQKGKREYLIGNPQKIGDNTQSYDALIILKGWNTKVGTHNQGNEMIKLSSKCLKTLRDFLKLKY